MAALVQSYPQQASTVTMLQPRPSSSGGSFSHQHSAPRSQQIPRFSSSSGSGSYRGMPSSGLVAPYAFTTTPQLTKNASFLHNAAPPHLRPQNRALSAPNLLLGNQHSLSAGSILSARQRFAASSSPSASSASSNSMQPSQKSMDDASITTRETSVDVPIRPKSTLGLPQASSAPLANSPTSPKPSPDRYRRGNRASQGDSYNSGPSRTQPASILSSGSGIPTAGHLHSNQGHSQPGASIPAFSTTRRERPGPSRNASTDDLSVERSQSHAELAQRYRRRSVSSIEAAGELSQSPSQTLSPQMCASRAELKTRRQVPDTQRPTSSHTHHGSVDSVSSTRSARSNGPDAVSDLFKCSRVDS